MNGNIYTVPYSKGEISFALLPGMRGTVVERLLVASSDLSKVQKFN
jgi:hypothetical protein